MGAVTPTGADELLVALQTPSPRGFLGVPSLIWGSPGEGKTSFVEAMDRPGFPVITLIASIHDPTDFSGMPIYDQQRMRFAPPEWISVFEEAQDGILFLDELTTAPPSVQAALLRVVLERTVGMRRLPDHVRIVAAANPPDEIAGGWELSPPLANRFLHLDWELSGAALAEALQEGFAKPELPEISAAAHRDAAKYWRMMVSAFLRRDPSLSRTTPADGQYSFASPRTWDYAIQLMASCQLLGKAPRAGGDGGKTFLNLLEGCIGSGAARSFTGFLKNLKLPDPEKVLKGKAKVKIEKLKDDELYVFFCTLASCVLERAQNGKADEILDSTLIVLSLVDEVNKTPRVDTIFAPLRQIARGQILQRAALAADETNRLDRFLRSVNRVFEDTPMGEYVKILHPKQDS